MLSLEKIIAHYRAKEPNENGWVEIHPMELNLLLNEIDRGNTPEVVGDPRFGLPTP